MNHQTTLGVIIHLSILGIMIIGVAYLGYKIWSEQSDEYKDWRDDVNK